MTSLLVTGYKSFELGIFKDKDPKSNHYQESNQT